MKKAVFTAARAVYFPFPTPAEAEAAMKEPVIHLGFHTTFTLPEWTGATVRVSARHVYRLYVNHELVMHGPARTAHGYARVDEVDVSDCLVEGVNHIAVEVMTYGDTYNGYSNDMAINDGPGFLICELETDGGILTATGRDAWGVCRIGARVTRAARLSHCREASEIYYLDEEYDSWKDGQADFLPAAPAQAPVLLHHDALLPSMTEHHFKRLVGFGACRIDPDTTVSPLFFEASPAYAPAGFRDSLDEHPLDDCRRTVDEPGAVSVVRRADGLHLSGADSAYVLLDGGQSFVGFPAVSFTCERDGIVDIVHTELLGLDGSVTYDHNIVARLHVKAGLTTFVRMEPCLARWIKLYFRGTGDVGLYDVSMLEYFYPDEDRTTFLCSDDDVNRLYNAAKRTLLLNTLDVFMDCPDRERGGWLCDSLWTSRAAALMLSDTRVEREFLENFLLTPADGMFHAFFPEAYPGNKPSYKDMTGITTWSFWLMCEVVEYYARTGDKVFIDEYTPRITAFVNGTRDFIGKSGLLENLPWLFIDWSESNFGEYQQPISTPANALYAYMLDGLGRMIGRPDWIDEGSRIRNRLRDAIVGADGSGLAGLVTFPDSFTCDENGVLHGRGRTSETGMATALWAGLFSPGEVPALDRNLRDCMGPAPRFTADPNVGTSQLFIGLCIRLDLLARRGHFDTLWKDLKAIYMPQLREGPGTLWEVTGIGASSRCHGFSSHAGVILMRDVLGIDLPDVTKKVVRVAPHVMDLRWASGTHETPDGMVSVSWQYDGERFTLAATVPCGYTCDLVLPREVRMLDEDKVKVSIHTK